MPAFRVHIVHADLRVEKVVIDAPLSVDARDEAVASLRANNVTGARVTKVKILDKSLKRNRRAAR